ncbi:hypothetical protein ACJJTC_003488 [Scirpophaga incertulas]
MRSTVTQKRSVVEERYAVRDRVDVLHQPVVELAAHGGRELADQAQRHGGREDRVVQQYQLEVAQPFDAAELAQQVEPRHSPRILASSGCAVECASSSAHVAMMRASGVRRARGSTRSARSGAHSPVSDAACRYRNKRAAAALTQDLGEQRLRGGVREQQRARGDDARQRRAARARQHAQRPQRRAQPGQRRRVQVQE